MIFSESELEGKSEEEQMMMKLMGFGGFDTTKVIIPLILFSKDWTRQC